MAYGAVDRRIWDDEKFRSWDRDTRAVWLYILTTPQANRLGCFVLSTFHVADHVQISLEDAERALQNLHDEERIVWDRELRVVCIRKHLHPDYNPLANPNVVKAALKDLSKLPDSVACLTTLYRAVEKWGQPTTAKGDPFYSLLSQALRNRLETVGETVTETVHETVTETTLDGLGNPDPDHDQYPDPEPDPEVGEADSPGVPESAREEADPPPSPPPDEESSMDRLIGYLGEEHRAIVQAVAATARKPDTWAMGFWGQYGPSGTEERLMAKVGEGERPQVLATALQRLTTEGEKYSGNFFRSIVRSVIRERNEPTTDRDFGDESARDAERRHRARQRATDKQLDQVDEESAEAEAKMAELWEWWEDADDETRSRIKTKAERRCNGVPDHLHRAILTGVIQEHREEQEAAA